MPPCPIIPSSGELTSFFGLDERSVEVVEDYRDFRWTGSRRVGEGVEVKEVDQGRRGGKEGPGFFDTAEEGMSWDASVNPT